MGATSLSQFLQSLCHNSHWSYAVFWKLQYENQIILTWEDGCYDHSNLRGSMESMLDDMCFNGSNNLSSSSWELSRHDGHSGEDPIGQAVADMAGVRYQWGEGIIGEVAYTESHRWVLFENISAGEFESEVVPEFPYEWLLQFAAGIKTVVLIPVIPHGVLQLGALEKVTEDQALVAFIKDKFNAYQNSMDLLPVTSMEVQTWTSSLLMPTVMDTLVATSSTEAVYGVKSTNNQLFTTNQIRPMCLVQDACDISREQKQDILSSTEENAINFQSMGLFKVVKPLDQLLNDIESDMMEGSTVGFSSLQEELQSFLYCGNYSGGVFGEHASAPMNSCSDGERMGLAFVDMVDNRVHADVNTSFSFPMDCELHKAIGPALLEQTKENLGDSSLVGEDARYNMGQIFNRDLIHGIEPSTLASGGCFAKEDDTEHLLEAVLTTLHGGWSESLSTNVDDVKLSITSSRQFVGSTKRQCPSESTLLEEKRDPWSSMTTAFGARDRNAVTESPTASSLASTLTTLIDVQQQQKKRNGYLQTGKGSKLSNAGKRRAKPGESQKPRPRDRQLIQDRVKELRELVPNGSKCSIDGLLDRTIKHMLFLRSVPDQAHKLKQWVHQEVTDRKNVKSSGPKWNRQNGTSWAFELGSDLQVCPIVVEDLDHPGHMLIEMLCNDHGLFLEIAEVICRFELTILKGVMESRVSNTWAHFIVEASRNFHRLDIFWPLMQLLQRNPSPVSSKI